MNLYTNKRIFVIAQCLLPLLISCNMHERSGKVSNAKPRESVSDFSFGQRRPKPTFSVPMLPTESDVVLDGKFDKNCRRKFMIERDSDAFGYLQLEFLSADLAFESLPYTLIAVDKFGIPKGFMEIVADLTEGWNTENVSKHSLEICKHYIKYMPKMKREGALRKIEKLADAHHREPVFMMLKDNPEKIAYLKYKTLTGSEKAYEELKQELIKNDEHDLLFYYSFVMADKYGYEQAAVDVIDILAKIYNQYSLGEFGKHAKYFISFFKRIDSRNAEIQTTTEQATGIKKDDK